MANVFNTEFEVSLRILLLLDCLDKGVTTDRATALDFIALYGKEFGITDDNLHGDNRLGFSELTAKRQMIHTTMKSMVLDGWLTVSNTSKGFSYSLSKGAFKAAKRLKEGYPAAYRLAVKSAIEAYGELSEEQLIEEISRISTQSLRR